jgi:hypothetical protein
MRAKASVKAKNGINQKNAIRIQSERARYVLSKMFAMFPKLVTHHLHHGTWLRPYGTRTYQHFLALNNAFVRAEELFFMP